MEKKDLKRNPFDHVHLQWFAEDPDPDPGTPDPDPEPKPDPEPNPPETPPVKPAKMGDPPKEYPKYMAQLPDDLKTDDRLAKFKTLGELGKAYLDAEGKIAFKPPESAEEYEFADVELPEELQGDNVKAYREELLAYVKANIEDARKFAFGLGLSKENAQKLYQRDIQKIFAQVKAAVDAAEKAKTDGLEALKKDWKGDFDPNTEVSRRAIETFGKDALVALFSELGVSNHPAVTKTFYEIGKAMGEGTLVPGGAKPVELSPEDQKKADQKARYPNSPELFGERKEAPAAGVSEALKGRYPSMETPE